jgi:lysophospholipase L1-like esterase
MKDVGRADRAFLARWSAGVACLGLIACSPSASSSPAAEFLVVALGDSFASGQGAPDEEFKWWKCFSTPSWHDERCKRSLNAPTHQAVASLEQQGHSIEYVSFACSGATIEKGLIGPYGGPEPPAGAPPLPAQVEALASTSGVDAVTISIGGNDVLFEYLVLVCAAVERCERTQPVVDLLLGQLRDWLELLAQELAELPIDSTRIFILEYPNLAQDSDGSYCDGQPTGDLLRGIDEVEAAWAAEYVLPRLNREICLAAKRHGWTFVGDIATRFEKHGWCAGSQSWINTLNESWRKQRDHRGALHPNSTGYAAVGDRLAEVMAPLLDGGAPLPTAECPAAPTP